MKLILQQYLASLRERNELDAIIPDLLSQLGLNVFSTPGRGTRQDGVDVAAVGRLGNDEEDKVYLLSIKAGDLTRRDWDGDAAQSLRPSLNEILDAFIANRLPTEHRGKKIVICACFGGVISEQVRPQLKGYFDKNTTDSISFEEWNGDKLAELIMSGFLQEDLMPDHARSQLRKALAMLDEPQASFKFFAALIQGLSETENKNDRELLTALRQLTICLWIHFSWARDAGNIEASYLACERALLHSWNIARLYVGKDTKAANEIMNAFHSILFVYHDVSFSFLDNKVLPLVNSRHALSEAVAGSCDVDINLRVFDILGRLATGAIWTYSLIQLLAEGAPEYLEMLRERLTNYRIALKQLLSNNEALLIPYKDNQAIDISLAVLYLLMDGNRGQDISLWLGNMINLIDWSFTLSRKYPCNISSYKDLLEHPQPNDEYLREMTAGSILYPIIGLSAALVGDEELFNKVRGIKDSHLKHCNFQLWFPDETSEDRIYCNTDLHGAALSEIDLDGGMIDFENMVFGECSQNTHFKDLSAYNASTWPLILVACRHYRLPIPVHLFEDFRSEKNQEDCEIAEVARSTG